MSSRFYPAPPMPKINASPRLTKATQLAQAEAREMIAPEAPPLLGDEAVERMERTPRPDDHRVERLFYSGGKHAYLSAYQVDRATVFVETLAKESGLEAIYKALLADEKQLAELAEEAASYAVGVTPSGKGLQLLEQGLDLSIDGQEIRMGVRRQSERGEISRERVRHRPLELDSEDQSKNFELFASNAFHARVDPRNGRFRRDGDMSTSNKSRANLVSGLKKVQRPNYSQFLWRVARSLESDAQTRNLTPEVMLGTQSLRALGEAGNQLCAEIAKRARAVAARRVEAWMERNGVARSYGLARKIWGDAVSLSDIEAIKPHADTVEAILAKGNLGLFSLRMARGFGVAGAPEDLVGQIKGHMGRLGLSDSGWRRLNQMDPERSLPLAAQFSRPITARGHHNHEHRSEAHARAFAQALSVGLAHNLPAETVEAIAVKAASANGQSRGFARAFSYICDPSLGSMNVASAEQARHYIAESDAKAARAPHVVKAFALRASQAGADAACEELELLRDYLSSSEMGVWQQLPLAPNWGQLMRAQREWHELVENQKHGGPMSWVSHVREYECEESGYKATALESGYALLQEGKAMHHCVSSYSKQCHEGRARIFSITRDGKRFGTLELRPNEKDPAAHAVAQFKGSCNAAIEPADAWAFAEQIAELYTKAARAAMKAAAPEPDLAAKTPAPAA